MKTLTLPSEGFYPEASEIQNSKWHLLAAPGKPGNEGRYLLWVADPMLREFLGVTWTMPPDRCYVGKDQAQILAKFLSEYYSSD